MADLSVLIAARNEEFLPQTVADVLEHARAETEVICVLDGAWPCEPLATRPRLTVVRTPSSIGQRGAINIAARLSKAPYVMKLDAHCRMDEGFDVKLIAAAQELGPDVTQVPAQYNLHVFDWQCHACGHRSYQGPVPTECSQCHAREGFDRVMVWQARLNRRTEFWRFDSSLHFNYWSEYKGRQAAKGELVDVMSCIGACFFLRRDRFWALGGLDEGHGSWGQCGTEVACKAWLSGGRLIVNKRTWYGHMFRTQGRGFGFPYPISVTQQETARVYSRKLWLENAWSQQVRPLSWLIDKFAPIPDWHQPTGTQALAAVQAAGERFLSARRAPAIITPDGPTKGLCYYTDNRLDPQIASVVRAGLRRIGLPLVSVSLQRLDGFGQNLVLPLERGPLTMFRQILAGLGALDTDIAFLVEHDILYHPSHFAFTPPGRDRYHYNQATWKVDATTGQALHYRCCQTSGLCADRRLLVEHYRRRVALVEQHGYDRNLGFEPGTNARSRAIDGIEAETWMSEAPNIDIRHGRNLTPSRWRQDQFRDKRTCEGWIMADDVPGWGRTKGRFRELLAQLAVEWGIEL